MLYHLELGVGVRVVSQANARAGYVLHVSHVLWHRGSLSRLGLPLPHHPRKLRLDARKWLLPSDGNYSVLDPVHGLVGLPVLSPCLFLRFAEVFDMMSYRVRLSYI